MERNCKNCKNMDCYWVGMDDEICDEYLPKTNADKIRTMTDEELAKELWAWNQTCCHKWKAEEIAEWLKEEYVSDKEASDA